MLRALFYVGVLALVCSPVSTSPLSNEHNSIWAAQLHEKRIGRVKYEDDEVILFSNQDKPTNIFFTPLPRVNRSSCEYPANTYSGPVELSLDVELYSSELIAAIHTYLKQHLPTVCNENDTCDVSVLPVHKVRFVQATNRMNPTGQMYTVNDRWHPSSGMPQSVKFHINTPNQSACEKLLSLTIKPCLLSDFEVQYSLAYMPNVLYTVPLTCSSKTRTTNQPLQLELELEHKEHSTTIRKLTSQLSQYHQQYIEQKNRIRSLTEQLSRCNQVLKEYQNPYKCKDRQWKEHATTVIGGNEEGNQLNQLVFPWGISIDQNNSILIADWGNHRIVQQDFKAKNRTIVAGRNRWNRLFQPKSVIVDKKQSHSIIIADQGKRRVIEWFDRDPLNQEILIENIDCSHLAMHQDGSLYVTDVVKHEVRRWSKGDKQGILVAGGNGRGNQSQQLNTPTFLFVDDQHSIYVSDRNNHRVMKWRKGATEGVVVAGGNGPGHGVNQLSHPAGVFVDCQGDLYVVDEDNHRVMRWRAGAEKGDIVVARAGKGHESNQLRDPTGLSFDDEGNLYVTDRGNHRVQKFDLVVS